MYPKSFFRNPIHIAKRLEPSKGRQRYSSEEKIPQAFFVLGSASKTGWTEKRGRSGNSQKDAGFEVVFLMCQIGFRPRFK
jgi:hypothetical protein